MKILSISVRAILHVCMILTCCAFISCSSKLTSNQSAANSSNPEVSLGWKLGAQAYTFNRFSFTEALSKIDSCGLRYVEAYPQQVIGGGITEKMDYKM